MGKKDITLKDYLSDAKRYADLLNGSLFQGRQVIHADELQETATVRSKSDKHAILERTNNIAMKQTQDGNLFAIWIIENQDNIDYSMPVRVMLEEALSYDRQIKGIKKTYQNNTSTQTHRETHANAGEFISKVRAGDRLHPVITLIIYWGEDHWQGAKTLHDMIDFGKDEPLAKELKTLVPEYPLHFLNLSEIHDYTNFRTELKVLFELYDRRNNKKEFQKYLHTYEINHQMDTDTYWTLSVLTGIKNYKNDTPYKEEENTNMWKAIEDLIADGKTEGRAEGKIEGKMEGKIEGKIEGRLDALYELVHDGLLSIKDAAIKASMPEDVFSSEMKKAGY